MALDLLMDLIRRPSVTPEDAGCQHKISCELQQLGFEIEHLRFKNVDNLWAWRGDLTKHPVVVFLGHTDVVPPGSEVAWQTPPFSPIIRNNILYGRGATDMKGSIAAMISAIKAFIQENPDFPGALGVILTSDEEGPARYGTVKVIESLQARNIQITYCIVGEPSSQQVLGDTVHHGRRGSITGNLRIFGRQGHVGYPEKAINPIHLAVDAIQSLNALTWPGSEHFCPTTLQWTKLLSDSQAENMVPHELTGRFNIRFSPPWVPETIQARLLDHFSKQKLHFDIEWQINGYPFCTKEGRLLTACQEAIATVTGQSPTFSTIGGTSDGRFVAPTGAEVVELGPISTSMHQVNEHISIDDLEKLVTIYQQVLQRLLVTENTTTAAAVT